MTMLIGAHGKMWFCKQMQNRSEKFVSGSFDLRMKD